VVRQAKGGKDRVTMRPGVAVPNLEPHRQCSVGFTSDLAEGGASGM
jgi:hypothetical protein